MTLERKRYYGFLLAAVLVLVAVALWYSNQGTPQEASAQQIVLNACERTAAQRNFDFSIVATGTEHTAVFNGEVSGENFKGEVSIRGEAGVSEVVGFDGVVYYREPGGVWQVDPYFTVSSLQYFLDSRPSITNTQADFVICPSLAVAQGQSLSRVGASGGQQRFRVTGGLESPNTLAASSGDTNIRATWEYWVGQNGNISQTRQHFQDDQVEWEINTRFSNVGQPNTITKPPGV